MCGRCCTSLSADELATACTSSASAECGGSTQLIEWSPGARRAYQPRYNVSPGTSVPVLVASSLSGKQKNELTVMPWGVVPHYHKGSAKEFKNPMSNARIESIAVTHRRPLHQRQRCAFVCEGFYEWVTESKGQKQPYYVTLPKVSGATPPLMFLAAVFDDHDDESFGRVSRCAVVTMAASESFSQIHHRQPAVLDTDAAVHSWLSRDVDSATAVASLQVYDSFTWHPVSREVGKTNFQAPPVEVDLIDTKSRPLITFLDAWAKHPAIATGSASGHAVKSTPSSKVSKGGSPENFTGKLGDEATDKKPCRFCTYINNADVNLCITCNSRLTDTLGSKWSCSDCTYLNDADAALCIICGCAPQPGTFDELRDGQKRLRLS